MALGMNVTSFLFQPHSQFPFTVACDLNGEPKDNRGPDEESAYRRMLISVPLAASDLSCHGSDPRSAFRRQGLGLDTTSQPLCLFE